jgi:NAD(P)-dependent dehydrogenase (short-subunit alcohol dehydrogenase family)
MKTVFITGASRGIGKEVAKRFASEGWFVGLYATNEAALAQVSEEIGTDISCYSRCDVTDPESVAAAMDHFASHTDGRMNVLVNNAGVLSCGHFEELDFAAYDKIIDINIKGMTRVAYTAFPLLKQTPGSAMINLCSASSIHGLPLLAIYSASKFYVNGLTEALNIEWKEHDIHVTAIKPPIVHTDMADAIVPQLKKHLTVDLEAEDIADVVLKAVDDKQVSHIVTTPARVWGLADKYLPPIGRRALAKWLTDY